MLVVLTLFAGNPAVASEPWAATGAVENGDPRVEVELLFDASTAQPGDEIAVGARFVIDPEWHVYWRNSGESGLSTEFTVDAGLVEPGPMYWPAPQLFVDKSGEVATFGYADEVMFTRTAKVPADAEGQIEVVATVDYLACKVDCIPGRHELKRVLQIGERKPTPLPENLLNRAPLTTEQAGLEAEVAYSRSDVRPGETFTATLALSADDADRAFVPTAAAKRFTFIPDVTPGFEWKTLNVEQVDGASVLTVEGRASRDGFEGECALAGVVWVGKTETVPVAIRAALPCSNEPRAETPPATSTASAPEPKSPAEPLGLAYVLLLALLGGMILNLMPCVFPVLAVKVFSFVKLAHENQSNVFRHSGAYTAGIVATMMALAGAVVGLKAAGTEVGWGFQFQEPLFIAALAAALVLFALNLFGVFEVTLGSGGIDAVREAEYGLRRSFGEGVLAVVLATPCSAPFLGTAVGFAFGADAFTIFAVFFALGIGLALPFAILTAVPSWAKLLPKPGAWMLTFKQVLGFALLATCVWLVWVLGQSVGSGAVASLLAFLLSIGFAAWAWGKVQWTQGAKKWLVAAVVLATVATTGWFTLDFPEPTAALERETPSGVRAGPSTWDKYDPERVRADVEAGNIVFVDFTADWCITCKVNERGVLSSDETLAMFDERGVKTYVADWTRKDDKIRAILAEHGKAGVPMYLLYRPGAPDSPEVLPELLTESTLRDALDRASN